MEPVINEEELEEMQKKTRKYKKIVTVVSMIYFLIFLVLLYAYMVESEEMTALLIIEIIAASFGLATVVFCILCKLIVKKDYDRFNEAYKAKYVLQIISQIKGFDKLQFMAKDGFSWDDIKSLGIVDCGSEEYYEREDQLIGEYENISFKISDVITRKAVRRNKSTNIEDMFSGQIICLYKFDYIKESQGHIQIFEKQFLSKMKGWKAKYEIHTENETFNNRFSVYASDEHNAYYILTPQRMEKITNFVDAVDGQVSLVFCDEKLFAAVSGDSMFDANIKEPVRKQTVKITKDAELIQKAKEILVSQ